MCKRGLLKHDRWEGHWSGHYGNQHGDFSAIQPGYDLAIPLLVYTEKLQN